MFFDSLTHPTLNGQWLSGEPGETFASVSRALSDANAIGGCAVGLPGVGDYVPEAYYQECTKFDNLFPVAPLTTSTDLMREIEKLAEIGFQALKIHPRLMGIPPTRSFLSEAFSASTRSKMTVFLCTYYYEKPTRMMDTDPYWHLVGALSENPETKVILLHGGGVRLLEYAELCRFTDNILLDVSFTFQKYGKSSLGADIQYLLESFDRKICFGTDSPEYRLPETLDKLDLLTKNMPADKKRNVMHQNLLSILDHPFAARPK